MEWHLNIPKVLHLYWGRNQGLSYMRYLTALSFSTLNPSWKIKIYSPKVSFSGVTWETGEHEYAYNGKDYWDQLSQIPGVSLHMIDFEQELGVPEELPEVFKSDVLRWFLLGTQGGIWSDFDIFYIRSMDALFLNTKEYKEMAFFTCIWEKVFRRRTQEIHSIGFLGATVSCIFYQRLYEYARERVIYAQSYQILGRILLESYCKGKAKGVLLPFDSVYPLPAAQAKQYYWRYRPTLEVHTIGLHWYAGHHVSMYWEGVVTEENLKVHQDIFLFSQMHKTIFGTMKRVGNV